MSGTLTVYECSLCSSAHCFGASLLVDLDAGAFFPEYFAGKSLASGLSDFLYLPRLIFHKLFS